MKRILSTIFAIAALVSAVAQVKPGVETLRDNGFEQLKGKRVGLLTNPTGVDRNLKSTIDILAEAPEVNLTALFAPEHGIRGDVTAGGKVSSGKDPKTGVKVYSVFGQTLKPTAAMLKGVDALVYDIQDNGCRSYTFISSMGKAMEAAAENGKEFIVLDRPNPLGGNRVEGPLVDSDCISFVSQYPIPYLYGLTPGELAKYLKGKKLIKGADKLKLTVVPMSGWKREMTYRQTGLPWVLPSPHIPTASTCEFYPASGIVGELDFLSIGVGYTLPFRTFAAPWIDGGKLADSMNALNLPGLSFRPITYTPYYGKFKGMSVNGVELYITDEDAAELTPVQFYILQELHKLYPEHKALAPGGKNASRFSMFDKVTGSKAIRKAFVDSGYDVEAILPLWDKGTQDFADESAKYLIY